MPEWRAVVGSEGRYEVSCDGQIRSLTFAGWPRKTPKVLKQRLDKDGYPRLNVIVNGKHTTWKVHQIVARAFIGECPSGHLPDHRDRVRANNCVDNLRYIPEKENGSKFAPELVLKARALLAEGCTLKRVSDLTGISKTHVRRIRDRTHWAHL